MIGLRRKKDLPTLKENRFFIELVEKGVKIGLFKKEGHEKCVNVERGVVDTHLVIAYEQEIGWYLIGLARVEVGLISGGGEECFILIR